MESKATDLNLENGCKTCLGLQAVFSHAQTRINLGLLDELLRLPCPTHDALLRWLSEAHRESIQTPELDGKPYNVVVSALNGAGQARIKVSRSFGLYRPGRSWDLLLVKSNRECEISGCGRILDSKWVNLDLAKAWMDNCLRLHGCRCDNPLSVSPVRPAWVIDVVDECLVPGPVKLDYIALSYRWGECAGFQTDRETLKAFQRPGGLSSSIHAVQIPPLIKHAIGLVRTLGERYLWADAVCLTRGDDEQMAQELQLMGAIYASAKMTIVCTDGDATAGIPGLEDISPPRDFSQEIFPAPGGGRILVRQLPSLQDEHGFSPYFERGWTFQEFLFSKRRLIFIKKQLHWKCACADWQEDKVESADDTATEQSGLMDIAIPGRPPDFNKIGLLLAGYNSRQLTFPEDALPGVIGLLALLSRSIQGGFLCGLAEACFDAALLWDSFTPERPMRRTPAHKGTRDTVLPQSHLPSWSWIGWRFDRLRLADESLGALSILPKPITIPITQWYNHETPNSQVKRAIQPHWYTFRQKFQTNPDSALPEGWVKEDYTATGGNPTFQQQPGFLDSHIYWHSSTPGQYHWSPIPFASVVNEEATPCMPPQYPYISCTTKRGWFNASWASLADTTAAERQWQVQINNRVKLVDGAGALCGWLQYLFDEEPDFFPRDEPAAAHDNHDTVDSSTSTFSGGGTSRSIELAAVCLQYWPTYKSWQIENEAARDAHAFYGVLWIEWGPNNDGIAYRKGSGFVSKKVWEAHALEEVHLVLG